MKVVGKALPFHKTTVPLTRLLPVTVSVKAGPCTVAAKGSSASSDGCCPSAVVAQELGLPQTAA